MSKPPFSRKRKGKKVDAYPLGAKGKSKSERTKGNKGRPRKPIPEPNHGISAPAKILKLNDGDEAVEARSFFELGPVIFAPNQYIAKSDALLDLERLEKAGASDVWVTGIEWDPGDQGRHLADAFIVQVPSSDAGKVEKIFSEFMSMSSDDFGVLASGVYWIWWD